MSSMNVVKNNCSSLSEFIAVKMGDLGAEQMNLDKKIKLPNDIEKVNDTSNNHTADDEQIESNDKACRIEMGVYSCDVTIKAEETKDGLQDKTQQTVSCLLQDRGGKVQIKQENIDADYSKSELQISSANIESTNKSTCVGTVDNNIQSFANNYKNTASISEHSETVISGNMDQNIKKIESEISIADNGWENSDCEMEKHGDDFDPYICDTCNKKFHSRRYLVKHIHRHINSERSFKCRFCPKELGSTFSRNQHERIHTQEKPYECDFCDAKFIRKQLLILHEMEHENGGPLKYLCEVCGVSFKRERYLREHRTIHTGEMNYPCTLCDKIFRRSRDRNRHIRSWHTKLICEKCSEVFYRKSELKRHLMSHSDRPYKCDQCDASFYQNTNLTKHKIIHTGLKPYKCNLCKTTVAYAHRSNLNKHFKTVHGITASRKGSMKPQES